MSASGGEPGGLGEDVEGSGDGIGGLGEQVDRSCRGMAEEMADTHLFTTEGRAQ